MHKVHLKNKNVFITGTSGFIGFFLAKRLLEEVEGIHIIGLDSTSTLCCI